MDDNIRDLRFRIGFEWRSIINQYPKILAAWIGWRNPPGVFGLSQQRTDLVIEGYPRSGNTFAWYAFSMSQKGIYEVLHHSHQPARIIESVKLAIPTLVLIRQPKDCVISYCIYRPELSLRLALSHWIRFYQIIKPHHENIAIAQFDDVISNFSTVIHKVNQKFITNFDLFDHTEKNVQLVFDQIEQKSKRLSNRMVSISSMEDKISRPSKNREEKQEKLSEQFKNDSRLAALLAKADELYHEWINY
jgi:hypothetical protein